MEERTLVGKTREGGRSWNELMGESVHFEVYWLFGSLGPVEIDARERLEGG